VKVLLQPTALFVDDDAGEDLNAFAVAFLDAAVHLDSVAHLEKGLNRFDLFLLYLFNHVHVCLLLLANLAWRCFVRCRACAARHLAISPWSPDCNTSGHFHSAKFRWSRVLRAFEHASRETKSSAAPFSWPIAPGNSRVTASTDYRPRRARHS